MKQAAIMLDGEADSWFARNRHKIGLRDPVGDIVDELAITPASVLEVGAADGWRLAKLRDKFGCKVLGIDPSMQACMEASKRAVPMYQMTANGLPADDKSSDLIIHGFEMYLCDPEDLFRIAMETDRVLMDMGHIIVHDFQAPKTPYKTTYHHRDGLWSYHYDKPALWLCHPHYSVVSRRTFEDQEVVVLKKNILAAFSEEHL